MGVVQSKLPKSGAKVSANAEARDTKASLASANGDASSLIEDMEEGRAAYHPGGFHPVYIGDVFNDRYEVLNKLGYGAYSTVWLVRDQRPEVDDPRHTFKALKILSAECYGQGYDTFEKEVLAHLRDGDRQHPGYQYICHMLDSFQHIGPNGAHVCLVFELMGETLASFGGWFRGGRIPYALMRRFTIQLVRALDYAHTHGVIHTDIKANNIFLPVRDYSKIESGYLSSSVPEQDREEKQYTPITSSSMESFYFPETDFKHLLEFNIVLGDWGVSSWKDNHLTETIQPVLLRAPEVLIEADWNESADWWNLGAVVKEVFSIMIFFTGCPPPCQGYQLKDHLDEIVHFFGPFPKRLLERGNQDIVREIFDENGYVKESASKDWPPLCSEMLLPGDDLDDENREIFTSFLQTMMKIDPEDRVSVGDLLRHPWLDAEQE